MRPEDGLILQVGEKLMAMAVLDWAVKRTEGDTQKIERGSGLAKR